VRVGLLWRAEWDPIDSYTSVVDQCKLRGVFAAFRACGVNAEPVVFTESRAEATREQLVDLAGVLVWVNPIQDGLDRSVLDRLLREAVAADVWVSADPDVIAKIGTKQVLVDTQEMEWGAETVVYRSSAELGSRLGERLAGGRAVVLKQHRGMGGQGVWKVELDDADNAQVRVQHAAGDGMPERLSIDEFAHRCEPYFAGTGRMVEQPFQPRLAEGMIRAYLTHDKVVGFTRQFPRGLMPPAQVKPATKVFELASAPAFATLRKRLESEWVAQLQQIVDVETSALPVIWDADFLLGPKTSGGEDTYVLCEINASSTFAFPEHAMPAVAEAAVRRIAEGAGSGVT
jgi:Domain of unknown function (DUF6815)